MRHLDLKFWKFQILLLTADIKDPFCRNFSIVKSRCCRCNEWGRFTQRQQRDLKFWNFQISLLPLQWMGPFYAAATTRFKIFKFSNLVVAAAMNGAFLCSGNNEIWNFPRGKNFEPSQAKIAGFTGPEVYTLVVN